MCSLILRSRIEVCNYNDILYVFLKGTTGKPGLPGMPGADGPPVSARWVFLTFKISLLVWGFNIF